MGMQVKSIPCYLSGVILGFFTDVSKTIINIVPVLWIIGVHLSLVSVTRGVSLSMKMIEIAYQKRQPCTKWYSDFQRCVGNNGHCQLINCIPLYRRFTFACLNLLKNGSKNGQEFRTWLTAFLILALVCVSSSWIVVLITRFAWVSRSRFSGTWRRSLRMTAYMNRRLNNVNGDKIKNPRRRDHEKYGLPCMHWASMIKELP